MYQLRSQIDLFYPYMSNTGVLTGAQFYLKVKKRVPEAFFGGLRQILGRKNLKKYSSLFLNLLHKYFEWF